MAMQASLKIMKKGGGGPRLSSMRFKGFVWPHNPTVYAIRFARNMAVHKIPFGRYHLQSLGMTRRVMKGEGEFVGEDAYRRFKELAAVFYEETPGTLIHPLWDAAPAWFVALELEQEPRPDYVKYRFEFWEDAPGTQNGLTEKVQPEESGRTAGSAQAQAGWHTVVKGETLWGIARACGMTLEALIALNPEIKNPNLIYVGQKVRVA